MTKENKNLLLKDLCARLPYKVIVNNESVGLNGVLLTVSNYQPPCAFVLTDIASGNQEYSVIEDIKPYLRPVSSMTEEEHEELLEKVQKDWSIDIDKFGDLYFDIGDACYPDIDLFVDIIDWLNKHYFDYRGLISKGLALEAPEGMYA